MTLSQNKRTSNEGSSFGARRCPSGVRCVPWKIQKKPVTPCGSSPAYGVPEEGGTTRRKSICEKYRSAQYYVVTVSIIL